jgi:predicted dehydrogenase/threonine dehydrogenase-like Zn-dependent dehydrogenase
MQQIVQSLRNGTVRLVDVPAAPAAGGGLSIRSRVSLLSAGTERMLLEFGRAGWIDKARQQPDKVRMVFEKLHTDGIAATLEAVNAKLDRAIAPGYSNAGVVVESGCSGFEPGDRVVSNGPHAEIVRVPRNLCAHVPAGVGDDAAAFTVVGAIALEAVRLAAPSLGECFAVTGLGLIGLITVQLLRAHGCRVLGIDLDPRKLELARSFGAETVDLSAGEDPIRAAELFSRGRGVDGVIIAATTKSDEPVHQAALMCRKRGRIILVGVTGLKLSRDDFYKKELSFQVSCSYGPGRYDPAYEEGGQDYPHAYVRWTAQRNFEAVLDMMADGRLDVAPLITHRFPFERALEAYELIQSEEFHLGVLLEYPADQPSERLLSRTVALRPSRPANAGGGTVGFVGAGSYATKVLIPAFRDAGAELHTIASSGGTTAAHAGRKFGFAEATTDIDGLLASPKLDTVVIATRHDSHASLVCRALQAGKHVFVEKPLAIREEELGEIEAVWGSLEYRPILMVGFNRRFAPQVVRMRQLLKSVGGPKVFVYTVNAGRVPAEHWTLDPRTGGGRIRGEACHFLDLLRHLAGGAAESLKVTRLDEQSVSIGVSYADGSTGTVHYLANGDKSFPKERLEVFCGGRILQLDNFRTMKGYGWPAFRSMRLWRQDKGANACVAAFLKAVREGGPSPISFEELVEVARVTLQAAGGE